MQDEHASFYANLLWLVPSEVLLGKLCDMLSISQEDFIVEATNYLSYFNQTKLPLSADLHHEVVIPYSEIKTATCEDFLALQTLIPNQILNLLTYVGAAEKFICPWSLKQNKTNVGDYCNLLFSYLPSGQDKHNCKLQAAYHQYFSEAISFGRACEIVDQATPCQHVWQSIVKESITALEDIASKNRQLLLSLQRDHDNRSRRVFQNRKRSIKNAVINRDGGFVCKSCGEDSPAKLDMDHIIPLGTDGGTNDIENIQVLCKTCHRKKHDEYNRAKKLGDN